MQIGPAGSRSGRYLSGHAPDFLNLYNSVMSNHMNDVMKVLTIFAAIFIPLTFIAGIYGTNFEYMPEIHYEYAYVIFRDVLLAVALTMVLYFKKIKVDIGGWRNLSPLYAG